MAPIPVPVSLPHPNPPVPIPATVFTYKSAFIAPTLPSFAPTISNFILQLQRVFLPNTRVGRPYRPSVSRCYSRRRYRGRLFSNITARHSPLRSRSRLQARISQGVGFSVRLAWSNWQSYTHCTAAASDTRYLSCFRFSDLLTTRFIDSAAPHPAAHNPISSFWEALFSFWQPVSTPQVDRRHPVEDTELDMLIKGEKWACEACVRGHRVSNCQHADRPLQHINKKVRDDALISMAVC